MWATIIQPLRPLIWHIRSSDQSDLMPSHVGVYNCKVTDVNCVYHQWYKSLTLRSILTLVKGVRSLVKSRSRGQVEGLQVLTSLELDLAIYIIYMYISQALTSHAWLKLVLTSAMLGSHTQISDLWVKGADLTSDSPLRWNVHWSTNGLNTSSVTKLSRSGSIEDINVLPVMLNSPLQGSLDGLNVLPVLFTKLSSSGGLWTV